MKEIMRPSPSSHSRGARTGHELCQGLDDWQYFAAIFLTVVMFRVVAGPVKTRSSGGPGSPARSLAFRRSQ
jgi:hypothetical protein